MSGSIEASSVELGNGQCLVPLVMLLSTYWGIATQLASVRVGHTVQTKVPQYLRGQLEVDALLTTRPR